MKYAKKPRAYNLMLNFINLLILILFFGCRINNADTNKFAETLKILTKNKNVAEDRALALKQDFSNTDKYRKGKQLYSDARAIYEGWIEEIKVAVNNKNPDYFNSEIYKKTCENAESKNNEFIKYIDNLPMNPMETGKNKGLEVILIPALIDIGKYLYDCYISIDENRKKEMISALDNTKWKRFEEIN